MQRLSNFQEALQILDIIEILPDIKEFDNYEISLKKGVINLELSNYNETRIYFKEAIEFKSDEPYLYFGLGCSLFVGNEHEQANKVFMHCHSLYKHKELYFSHLDSFIQKFSKHRKHDLYEIKRKLVTDLKLA